MKRREFVGLLGTAAAWPIMARAQQPAMPVVRFVRNTPLAAATHLMAAFQQGLKKAGFVEGPNVVVEYHSGEGWDVPWPSGGGGRNPPAGGSDRRERHCGACSQGSNHDDTDRLRYRRRSGKTRLSRQPQPTGWQRHGRELFRRGVRGEATGAAAPTGAQRGNNRRARQSEYR